MTFKIKIADYILGNRSASQFPEIAETGMKEGLESNALAILAGMDSNDNIFELKQYFEEMIRELNYILPNKLESAYILFQYYLSKMVENPEDSFELMTAINNIYNSQDWKVLYPELENDYIGQPLGLEKLYTWYRELSDFNDGDRLFYYNELNPNQQKAKFKEHLIEEAKIWLENHNIQSK